MNKISFLKFVFLYNKKNVALTYFKKENRGRLVPRKCVFRLLCINAVTKEYKPNGISVKFPWRLEGVKSEVQSIQVRELRIFMYVIFFVKKVGHN